MAPFERPLPPIPAPRTHQLQSDIDAAARSTIPVLITAPPDVAGIIVQAIAARSHRDLIPLSPPGRAGDDDVIAAIADKRFHIRTSRGAILWLKEVGHIAAEHQPAVVNLLDVCAAQRRRPLRIVASSSADLFELVESGSFDPRLFYRLNTIHIVVQRADG